MVAFNFKAQFANAVQHGRKCQSIRKSAKCSPGDAIQLYTGQRTKDCRKLGDAICKFVEPIEIFEDSVFVLCNRFPYTTQGALDDVAKEDGFKSWWAFKEFFKERYGLPFKGYVHTWELKPTPQSEAK